MNLSKMTERTRNDLPKNEYETLNRQSQSLDKFGPSPVPGSSAKIRNV